VALDATEPLPFALQFDRILVDAPCSGTGTLAPNPEIKWRLKLEDLPEFQDRQRKILAHALDRLAPGGKLVYATCSLEREENEDVVEGLPVIRTHMRLPGRDPGDGFFAAVIAFK
jgi:16S rRNA (cytosine967-C5)-methyltransferase